MNKFSTTQSSIGYYQEQPRNNNNNTILNPYNPSTTNVHDLNPKDKPVTRIKRSRSSRKSPTTLLNANVNNFRTLVQQYTGCQRANSSFLKMRKGPISLNFAGGNNEDKEDVKTISVGSNTTSSEGFGYNNRSNNDDYYYQETSQVMPGDHHQTFGNSRNNLLSDISADMLSVDDYFMENNTSFSW
ncbi:hypothetical protein LIER_35368 [Lithospermum erythrorhizon]|uniref:VQ domain-containing protein n=1 Tax=Lithospermum erythrorhizon TaxID=34254 RepID=A0AAV3NR02_LITER